jgi:hypothetical protein
MLLLSAALIALMKDGIWYLEFDRCAEVIMNVITNLKMLTVLSSSS